MLTIVAVDAVKIVIVDHVLTKINVAHPKTEGMAQALEEARKCSGVSRGILGVSGN